MRLNFTRKTAGNVVRLVVGHGAWVALALWWGPLGLVVGGIIALLTAPRGYYE